MSSKRLTRDQYALALRVRWLDGGCSPDTGWDCGGLVVWGYQVVCNLTIPLTGLALYHAALNSGGTVLDRFQVVDQPQDMDIVAMRKSGSTDQHVGLWREPGGVLHIQEPGPACLDPMQKLRHCSWDRIRFWRLFE